MPDEESLRQLARSPASFSVWFGIVVLFALFGVIVLATIGPAPRGDTYEEKRAKKRLDGLKTLREEDAKALTTYAWVDKGKGVARIPIERAMDLTTAQLAQTKPVPAGPIATPPPQQSPAAAASPGASPARASSPAASPTPKPKAVQGVESATRGQPAAAVKPAPAQPSTQPGASASPAAPAVPAATATPSSTTPSPTAPGSPLPIRGKTPP
jgi:hypothetical protein